MLEVERTNTVLYCVRWDETVAFYRDTLGLPVSFENDWFVEFALHPGAFISVADAARSSIRAGDGAGVTLSWQVPELDPVRASIRANGIEVGPIRTRFGSPVFDVFDPVGNRIEFWSNALSDA